MRPESRGGERDMEWPSFRQFVDHLRFLGEVVDVECEVDWDLELGAVVRRAYDVRAPAPLFHRIAGCREGFRVLGGAAGLSARPNNELCRIALAVGLAPGATGPEIVARLADTLERPPIPAQVVDEGACKECRLIGTDVDLESFPFPKLHAADGGRYVNTYGVIVVRAPDRSWVNWSIARQMLVGPRELAGGLVPAQHLGVIHQLWENVGEPTPFATVLGADPLIPFFAGMSIKEHASEGAVVGAHRGSPLPVVKCETVDLEVPADAELVIEGYISRERVAREGPIGEYTGYVDGEAHSQPVWEVTAVTHRAAPIIPVVCSGTPAEENHTVWGVAQAAAVLAALREADLPVTACWMPFESACHLLVVAVDSAWPASSRREELGLEIGDVVFGSKAGFSIPRIVLVDDDIDVCDLAHVVWAYAVRCHPTRDNVVFPDRGMLNLPIYLSEEEKSSSRSDKVLHNCLAAERTKPYGPLEQVGWREGWPKDVRERVLEKWSAYGFSS
jgi:4-hydroxy-3-polyprenylbenzoate decarboxylase